VPRPEPTKVKGAINPNQDGLVGELLAERARHGQLRLPPLLSCQHRHLRFGGYSGSKHNDFFNTPGAAV
jgi:hypothetical protein